MKYISKRSGITLGIIAATLITSPLSAQSYSQGNRYNDTGRDNYNQGANYVTVYEDCDFRGKSRALDIGEYNNIRDLNIGNDAISSVQVPQGLRLVLFEHERLRGKSTLITSDIRCLNKSWNDEASSIQVSGNSQYQGNRGYTNQGYGNQGRSNQGYDNNRNNNRNNNQGYDNRNNRGYDNRGGFNNQGKDYTKGVNYVAFANTAFERGNANQWRIVNQNGSVDTFRETGRDRQRVYLRNNRVNQEVELNLFNNQVRFTAPNGKTIDYAITSTDDRRRNQSTLAPSSPQPSGVISSGCFNYRAYTTGGQGGVRFHGHDGFHQFYKKGHKGRICHDGKLTMEINKKQPATEVIVDINGDKYRFGKNEKADALKNTWYRKKVDLQVGR